MSTKFDSTYSAVVSMAEQLVGEGKYDSTYSAVLAIYQNLTSDMDTKFDSVYSIVVKIADGIESGDIDLGGGGSGSDDIKDYNTHKFYNANGELVEEWTLEETQSKTELPVVSGVPFRDWTLDFDGWNWDLEQLKSASCGQNIGAMYRPSDGKTRIGVEIEPENLTYVLFVSGDYTIDWGDGTIETEWGTTYPTHTYDSPGPKQITISGDDWNPLWGVSPIYSQIQEGYPGWYYSGRVTSFFSGGKLRMLNFGYCTNLEFLTFTSDTHVYDSSWYKFDETKSLKYLAIPKGIKSYPQPGKSIEVISVPYGVTSIGDNVFQNCSSLQSVNIPDSVTSVGWVAFENCTSLQSINIPDSVTSVGGSAFKNCYSLQFINIPDGVTSIGQYAFNSCTSLQSVNIPDGVTSIGQYTFNSCSSLQSINIPDSVTSISDYAFFGCSSLQSVNIPDGVTSIGNIVFQNCYSLQSVNIPYGVTSIRDNVFQNCYSLQSVNIPDSVTSVGEYAFRNCYSLQSVNIPYGVTSIRQYAFNSCSSLQSINIPDSVTSVGWFAFQNCKYITLDFSDNTQIPTLSSTNAFDSTALILVPESLYDEWIASTNWSSLSSQIKPVPGK